MTTERPIGKAPHEGANLDAATVAGFGREWSKFRQTDSELAPAIQQAMFAAFFGLFPWEALPANAVGIDVGCGSGRWDRAIATRVGHLHLLDASADALAVARANLRDVDNVSFHHAAVDAIPVPDASLDFAVSVGVLHHVPDTAGAIRDVAGKLKPGAPFLCYLYYAFDNRPAWFRGLWRVSDALRKFASRLPYPMRIAISETIAALVYWPLARIARALDARGRLPAAWPLSFYRDKSYYVMRTDAFDRFCTRLEQRFTRAEIETMLRRAGMSQFQFADTEPYWRLVAFKNVDVSRSVD
jgi:SAM-dependent methyltransferase